MVGSFNEAFIDCSIVVQPKVFLSALVLYLVNTSVKGYATMDVCGQVPLERSLSHTKGLSSQSGCHQPSVSVNKLEVEVWGKLTASVGYPLLLVGSMQLLL